ncbi:5070_t:CDS:2, partial [Cetraspora pellucida]
ENMSADIEDDDSYTFELTQIVTRLENAIENEINDLMNDDTIDEFENETDGETETEIETTNNRNKKKTKVNKNSRTKKNNNTSQSSNLFDLPLPPLFQKLQHTKPYHYSQIKLSDKFGIDLQLNMIVENTNYYAVAKSAGKGHEWVSLTTEELLIWLALIIYMGVFKLPSREDYWKMDWKYPQHKITKYMTL